MGLGLGLEVVEARRLLARIGQHLHRLLPVHHRRLGREAGRVAPVGILLTDDSELLVRVRVRVRVRVEG